MYEHHKNALLSRARFTRRVIRHILLAISLIAVALGIGVLGYHSIAGFSWTDSLLNASMILGGMGEIDPLTSQAAKIFASVYALFSGLAFIGISTVLLAPFVHRLLHHLHLPTK